VFPSDRWKKQVRTANGIVTESVSIKKAISDLQALQTWVQGQGTRSLAEAPFVYEFPTVGSDQVLKILKQESKGSWLNRLRIEACKNHRRQSPGKFRDVSMRPVSSDALSEVSRVLESGVPVNVDYFYGVLENQDQFKKTIPELHTSIVLGQKWDPSIGQCRYLVKNSYGPDCRDYDRRHQCESGYLWIGERALKSALVSYVFATQKVEH
jgi:hypothetical protein